MRSNIKVPELADDVETATVVEWYVGPGSKVEAGTTLVVIEVDNVDMEITAPVERTTASSEVTPGDTVSSGSLLCVIDG